MPSRIKLSAVAAIISAGVAGAWWFRHPQTDSTADGPTPHALERRQAEVPSQQPTQGQLLGRIEPTATDGSFPTVADSGDRSQLGEEGVASSGRIVPFTRDPDSWRTAGTVDTASVRRESTPNPSAGLADMPADSPWSSGQDSWVGASNDGRGNPSPASSRPRTSWKKHRVADGDTLSSLAQHYLKDANRWLEIYQLNQDQLKDPDVLPIGARIKIPEPADNLTPQTAPVPGPQTSLASERWSRVEASEAARNVAPMVPIAPGAYQAARDRARGTTYRVQPRDTLVDIARKFYGEGGRFQEIYEANRDRIPDPNNLPSGVVLVIP